MDFDYSWKEPTEAQLAAWEMACTALKVTRKDRDFMRERHHTMVMMEANRRAYAVDADILHGPAHAMTPYTLAEMILLADGSLWYTQAKSWANGTVPSFIKDEGTKTVFKQGAANIVRVIEYGYKGGKWWDLEALWPKPEERALALVFILDVCRMATLGERHTLNVISQGFAFLPVLLLPKQVSASRAEELLQQSAAVLVNELRAAYDADFCKKWQKAKREGYEPMVCIHPKCDNLVAPKGVKPREGHHKNYRGTGACQRGHNSYLCLKCNAPHSFASKVGQAHYDEFYGKDFDGTDMQGKL